MANWRLFPVDRCANRTGAAQVTASSNATLAKNVVDSRQTTVWTSGTTSSGTYVAFAFDQQFDLGAIALGNGKNIAGELIRVWSGLSLGDKDAVMDSFTWPASGHRDVLYKFTVDNQQFILFDFASAISATLSIGTASFLDQSEMIEFSNAEGVMYPIVQPLEPGFAETPLVGGGSIRKVTGGPVRRWILNLSQLAAESGNTYDKIRDSLVANNGWINGVWVTTHEHDNSAHLRAYYCRPAATSPIQSAVTTGGAYADMLLELVEFQRGPI